MDSYKYSFKNPRRENLSMTVYNTGYQQCDRCAGWGPAVRDHYLIHFVAAGHGRFTGGGMTYTLQAGDLFLILPSELVSYAPDEQDPWEYYWVGFNGTEAKRMVTLAGLSAAQPVLHPREAARVRHCLLRIYESRGCTPAADADMAGYLYLLMGELIRQNSEQVVTCGTQEYLAAALRFIQYNYAASIGVNDIASFVGISRSQLYRAFVAQYGLSPHEFLQKYRISEACSLLQSGQLTIAEVAGSVGFSDPLYFSRIFRQVMACTPSAYLHERAGKQLEEL